MMYNYLMRRIQILIQNPLACSARFLRLDNENKLMSKSQETFCAQPSPAQLATPALSSPLLLSVHVWSSVFFRPAAQRGSPKSSTTGTQTDGSQRPSFCALPFGRRWRWSRPSGGSKSQGRRRDLGRRWGAAFQPGYRRGSRYGIGLAK